MFGWRFVNQGPDTTELLLFDLIGRGYGISSEDFVRELRGVRTNRIDLFIDSRGGVVDEGLAMFTELQRWQVAGRRVVAHVTYAGSISSVIMCACAEVLIAPLGQVFVHPASVNDLESGQADDLRKAADSLDVVNNIIAAAYVLKSGKTDVNYWARKMSANTTFNAQQAVAEKLADAIER